MRRPEPRVEPIEKKEVPAVLQGLDKELVAKLGECYNEDGIKALLEIIDGQIDVNKERLVAVDYNDIIKVQAKVHALRYIKSIIETSSKGLV